MLLGQSETPSLREARDFGGQASGFPITAWERVKQCHLIAGLLLVFTMVAFSGTATAAETLTSYYAHPIVEDSFGVVAPWYKGRNGQLDYRVRRAAEVLLNSGWSAHTVGGKALKTPTCFWGEGDPDPGIVQRGARALFAFVEYYRYSGDPAAPGQVEAIANAILELCQTGKEHPWPQFLMSVPYGGVGPDGKVTSQAYIQLDIVAEFGVALLRAYQLLGNEQWLESANHWADVLAEKRNCEPCAAPWPRYANPEVVPWAKNNPIGNRQTGGVVYILSLFDELIKLGRTGKDNGFSVARAAGLDYLHNTLLPAWAENDTWGRNYWDWENPVQAQVTTDWAVRYFMTHKEEFPNWKNDVRNIMSLFLNHSSAAPQSRGDVYHGAWQFPEGCGCCGRSLAWGPMELALNFAQYGVEADSEWARELARRMILLATYDVDDSGAYQDNIDGGVKVGNFAIVQYTTLKWVLRTLSWLPEILGAGHENHIMRSTEVVREVQYGAGRIAYRVFAAPQNTVEVLRLAFSPVSVTADGEKLPARLDLTENGYMVKTLPGGDCVVSIRHDGHLNIEIFGNVSETAADSAASGGNFFGEGGGPQTVQRMIFGYTGRIDYRDVQGNLWRPGTEFAVLTGHLTDTVAKTWWTMKQAPIIAGTPDGDLYNYGVHWPEFVVNVTVGPGTYYARLKFAETHYVQAGQRGITIEINKRTVVEHLDVFSTAGGANKAVDLVFNGIEPRNGIVEIRFKGTQIGSCPGEAMIQALEVGPGEGGTGAVPKCLPTH